MKLLADNTHPLMSYTKGYSPYEAAKPSCPRNCRKTS